MIGSTVMSIRPTRVTAVEVLHPLGKATFRDADDEMEVVRHQAVRQDDPLPPARRLVEKAEKGEAVPVFPVEGLPVVPAAPNVVDPTGDDYARTTRHAAKLAPWAVQVGRC